MIAEGTNLSMVGGDSDSITIRFKRAGNVVPFELGDTVYFSVKKKIKDNEYILQKIITEFTPEGTARIPLLPSETNDIPTGTYKYDVQVNFKGGRVLTVIEPSDFTLRGGVTHD